MFHKWSHEEDLELKSLVSLHATDWHKIEAIFSTKRSRNALIKRWHTKLKTLADSVVKGPSDHWVGEEEKSPFTDNTFVAKTNFQSGDELKATRDWSEVDDARLKSLVFDHHQYDWGMLAKNMDVTEGEAQKHWDQRIYPVIKSVKKIAGALMWTKEEDEIIFHAIRKPNYKWENLLLFLPGRSYFSLEARWKRLSSRSEPNKKSVIQNIIKSELRARNHQLRLKQYRNLLKLRKTCSQRLRERSMEQDTNSYI